MKIFLAVLKGLIRGICGIITALFMLGVIGIDSEYGFGYTFKGIWDVFTGKKTSKEFIESIERAL